MAEIWKGKPVADRLNDDLKKRSGLLRQAGIKPCLGIVRVGEKPSDIAYENGARKRAEKTGVSIWSVTLPEDITSKEVEVSINALNEDPNIHGILPMMPMPSQIDQDAVKAILDPLKDVDGMTPMSMASLFAGSKKGFAPCTAEACMEILDYYGEDLKGKNAVVIGRSTVIGKPVSMMLLKKNATVTICHTKTKDIAKIASNADILITSAGKAGMVDRRFMNPKQKIIDVSVNFSKDGKMIGDVVKEDAEKFAYAYTPVPGGVGAVTTGILMRHVIESAERFI